MTEEALFALALAAPAADRAALLDRECPDPALRARVEALLAADADATRAPLPEPPTRGAAPVPDCDEAGAVLAGKYKLVERIGEGGMGTVWLVQQSEPVKRRVALKLVKSGMDSRSVLARFEAERQALAMMDHPNIAKVLDAGLTPDNRPFFVMELVKGAPITEFCDARKLTPKERLELFVPVCQAIQHAHQKGVIHRDIKPSNVLVALYDDRAVPKVIDFGVAKSTFGPLTDQTLNTGFGGVVGTPQYMSPEQATLNNLDIDTRSDVYSLGVLLYELLAGSPPFARRELQKAGLLEILRVVREEEPPRPSNKLSTADALPSLSASRGTEPRKLTGLLRNELDWIVMKALEKDRTRRYETANGFAADVNRYLAGEAVLAHPPSALYRLRKTYRKHRGPVAAAAVVLLALVAGVVGTTLGLIEAKDHERAAVAARSAEAGQRGVAEANERRAVEQGHRTAEALRRETEVRVDLEKGRQELDAKVASLSIATQFAADAAHAENRGGRAKSLLHEVPERFRGFEWHHRMARFTGSFATLYGHAGSVSGVAWSPDGRRLATASEDRTLKVWDAETGAELRTFKGQVVPPSGLAWSPDGRRLASGSGDVVRVWDADADAEPAELSGHASQVRGVAFSPDGRRLASGSEDGTVRVWAVGTAGRPLVLTGHRAGVLGVAWSPDGARIVSGSKDRGAKVWDAATGAERATLEGHADPVTGVAWSPDGGRIATGSTDGTVRVWDAGTGKHQATFGEHADLVSCVAWSPDGRGVAAGSWGKVTVWDAEKRKPRAVLTGHARMVESVAFSPDGTRIASGSWDQTAKVWDADATGRRATLRGHTGQVRGVAFSPDGTRIASGSEDTTVRVWDAATGAERGTLAGHQGSVTGVAWSPDGRRIASSSRDKTVRVWDADGAAAPATLAGHTDIVWAAEFHPDGRRIVSASLDRTVRVWDAATGAALATLAGHAASVVTVAFSPDGTRIASGSIDGVFKLWDAATGAELATLTGLATGVVTVAFGPGGRPTAATHGVGTDGSVRRWDAATGAELAALKGHTEPVWWVAPCPDGRRIATASEDCTAKLWDAATGAELATLQWHARTVNCVAWSADGWRIATASDDNAVRVWDAVPGPERQGSPDWDWRTLGRRHPTRPLWVHLEDDKPVLVSLEVGDKDLARRRTWARFEPGAANHEYTAASTPYAKGFWKGRFAFNLPNDAAHWQAFQKECTDEATYRLMRQTCDLVLQRGPNEHATRCREWAVKQPVEGPPTRLAK